jgi:serine/threonine protein kinase
MQRHIGSIVALVNLKAITPKPNPDGRSLPPSGVFGQAYDAVARPPPPTRPVPNFTPGPLTVKVIPLATPLAQRTFVKDVESMYPLRHPCIVRLTAWKYLPQGLKPETQPDGAIFLRNYPQSLASVLARARNSDTPAGFDDTQKSGVAVGLAFGMAYLHSQNIIQRDLKPANVLLDEHFFPKITDYWIGNLFDGQTMVTTAIAKSNVAYLAPEIDDPDKVFGAVDVYSFGMILAEMLMNAEPYPPFEMTPQELWGAIQEGKRPDLSAVGETPMVDLIKRCLDQDPLKRPTFEKIINNLQDLMFDETAEIEYTDRAWDLVQLYKAV